MDRKAVVITGASTGIGEACTQHLANKGYLVFAGVRSEDDATRLRHSGSSNIEPLLFDVTDRDSLQRAADRVHEQVGISGVTGLINNAGIAVGGPLEFVEIDELKYQFDVNVIGLVSTTQTFLELVRKGKGRIVNIGSVGGRMSSPFVGPYAATKHAVEALTDALRVELRPWGIHVAVVEPGAVATPIWDKGQQSVKEKKSQLSDRAKQLYGEQIEKLDRILKKMAADGIDPMLVAEAVDHALSASRPRARYLVGGLQTKVQARIDMLPYRLRDKIVSRVIGLK